MSSNLAETSKVTKQFAEIFGSIDRLENLEATIARLAPKAEDEQLIHGRNYARQLGKTAWKIEVICDAEIWRRTKRLVGGRGHTDTNEEGVMAAVNKRAHDLGCGASTVLKNVQIFNQFETTLISESTLDDKSYYQAALSAPDPDAALDFFAAKRAESPFYLAADAWRDVAFLKAQVEIAKDKLVSKVRTPDRQKAWDHLQDTKQIMEMQRGKSPEPSFKSRIYDPIIKDIQDMLDVMFVEDARIALEQVWEKGYRTDTDMARVTGLPMKEVNKVMRDLESDGLYFSVDAGADTDVRRGKRGSEWVKRGERLGSDMKMPRAEPRIVSVVGED